MLVVDVVVSDEVVVLLGSSAVVVVDDVVSDEVVVVVGSSVVAPASIVV